MFTVTMQKNVSSSFISIIAKIGLISKGLVYGLIGVLVIMSAFEIGSQSGTDVNKEQTFDLIQQWPAGSWWLGVVAVGLFCYVVWRLMQAFMAPNNKDGGFNEVFKRARYLFSALVYSSLAFLAAKKVLHNPDNKSSSSQNMMNEVMSMNMGEWIMGAASLVLSFVGIYQIYYGYSEAYKKHVSLNSVNPDMRNLLLKSGKIGYVARGMVWLILAWLFAKAAWYSNASEAGDTAKAFHFLERASYGSYLLGTLGLGLFCYGLFNFIRAGYERFEN